MTRLVVFGSLMSALFSSACVSKMAGLSSDRNTQTLSKADGMIRSYEIRPSLGERFDALVSNADKASMGAVHSSGPTSEPHDPTLKKSEFESLLGEPVVLMLRSEQWSDVVNETSLSWKMCSSSSDLQRGVSNRCRALAHVRSVAFARLGHLKEALGIHDFLSNHSFHSSDALLFARLLSEQGSSGLCAQLAGAGLQWQPVENRLELFALQAKCFRLEGQNELARSSISRGLAEYPDDSLLVFESALLYLSERNLTQGCDLLERLYLRDFRDVAVSYHWGSCLVGRQDADSARRVLERARQGWPSERLWILLSGEVLFLEGDLNGARREGLDYLASAGANDLFRLSAERLIRNAQGE